MFKAVGKAANANYSDKPQYKLVTNGINILVNKNTQAGG